MNPLNASAPSWMGGGSAGMPGAGGASFRFGDKGAGFGGAGQGGMHGPSGWNDARGFGRGRFEGGFGSGQTQGGMPGSSGSAVNAQVAQDFQKLQTDMQAVRDKSEVTPKELAAVRTDLQAIETKATSKPDATKVATLTTDLKAVGDQLPTSAQTQQLTADFTAVVQSEGVTDANLIDQTIADIQAVITSTNLTTDDLTTLAADRQAIQKDFGTGSTTTAGATSGSGGTMPGGPLGSGFGEVLRMTLAPAFRGTRLGAPPTVATPATPTATTATTTATTTT